jgi:hypothetical protein
MATVTVNVTQTPQESGLNFFSGTFPPLIFPNQVTPDRTAAFAVEEEPGVNSRKNKVGIPYSMKWRTTIRRKSNR